jgi:serine/threonine-protein kinase
MEEEQTVVADPLINAQVGNYQVKAKLGEGGMGAVYLAEHPLIGKRVALKVLHSEFASNQDVVTRFFNEAKAVNDIQHPNIVDIIDYGVIPDPGGGSEMVYFIMEFLNGYSLSDVIAEQAPLPPERALQIGIQVADALAASHNNHIVHRDLKPDNIILIQRRSSNDFVKLLDFGIAKLTGDQQGSNRTRTGIVMGTPAYMSPEQCEGKGNIDSRTDIYALGVVLYEMLTGRVPFQGEGYGEVLVQHLTQPPERLSSIRSVIPPHVEAVCMKALEKRPEQRYQTMEDFMAALADPVGFVEANGGLEGFWSADLGAPTLPHTPPPGQVRAVTPGAGSGVYNYTPAPGSITPAPGAVTGYPSGGKSKTPLIIGAVAVAAIAAGAVVLLGGRGEEKSEAAAATEVAIDAAPATEPAAAADTEPAADPAADEPDEPEKPTVAAPVKVTIRVKSEPRGASIFLNGEDTGNKTPYATSYQSSELPVTLTLRKSGYEDHNVIIDYEDGAEGELGKRRQKLVAELTKKSRSGRRRSKGNTTSSKTNGKTSGGKKSGSSKKSGDDVMAPSLGTKKTKKPRERTGDNTMAPSF